MKELMVSMLNVLFLNCKYGKPVKEQLDRMTTYEYSFEAAENIANGNVVVTANKIDGENIRQLPIKISFDLNKDNYIKKITVKED